jgi:hypothetical protein
MRIFAFGCSFTNYWWPTWADILAHDAGCEYHNFGISGTGNVSIFSRMVQADNKYKFTSKDKIYVMWSGWHRHDKVLDNGDWHQTGPVNWAYSKDWLKENWSMPNDVMKNYVSIISANTMFNISWQGHMTKVEIEDEYKFFDYDVPNANAYFKNSKYYKIYENIVDPHPSIDSHIDYLENEIKYKVKQSTKNYFKVIDEKIKKLTKKDHCHGLNMHNTPISTFWKNSQNQCKI